MSESDTPRETCETCYGLGRVDAVYAPCPDCELTAARAEIERLDTAGIHSCHKDCQRPNCVLRRERDEARRLAEKYRNLSCDSQEEADETLLPWETTNPNEQ